LDIVHFSKFFRVCAALYNLEVYSEKLNDEELQTYEQSRLLNPAAVEISVDHHFLVLSDYQAEESKVHKYDEFKPALCRDLQRLYEAEIHPDDPITDKFAIGEDPNDKDYPHPPTKRQKKEKATTGEIPERPKKTKKRLVK